MSDLEKKLLGDWGFELSMEELSAVSGGAYGQQYSYGNPIYDPYGSGKTLWQDQFGYFYSFNGTRGN